MKILKNKSWILICLLLSLIITVLTQETFVNIDLLKSLELKTIDLRFAERGDLNISDSSDVVILEITQEAYDQIPSPYNSWPWPRSIFARLINNLEEAGVRAIGIDIVMSKPDQFDLKNDSLLISAIKKSGKVVVAGKIDTEREQIIMNLIQGEANVQGSLQIKENENYSNIFYEADSSIGIVNVPNDYDGVYRRYQPFVYSFITTDTIPTFGFALLQKYFSTQFVIKNKENTFELNDIKIPKFSYNSILLNFYSIENGKDFRMIKLIDVLDDEEFKTKDEIDFGEDINTWADPDFRKLFKDKIVIIGSTMPEDKDYFPVSLSKKRIEGSNLMYGVKLHATAVQNVIDRNFIYKESSLVEIIKIVFLVFLFFLIAAKIKTIKRINNLVVEMILILIVVGVLYLYFYLAVKIFISQKILLAIVSPSLAIITGYISSTVYYFLKERQQSILIKGMFSQYVSGALVNELIQNPDKLKLGGEKKELSILFSDIAGFSTISEKMTPEQLVTLINEYLSAMTEIVLKNKGTLDKYIGDAVMAFWGAPLPLENHADLACSTALEMKKKLAELKKNWRERNIPELDIRIGVNSGEVVVGNMGGEQRFDYTVMGDEVNLASRLEGANKQYGSTIMISDSVKELLQENSYYLRELDTIKVKGKNKPTQVFELVDNMLNVNPELYADYISGLELYKKKHFEEALIFFEKSFSEKKDYPSKVYSDRCKILIKNPPAPDWDGVFVMTTK